MSAPIEVYFDFASPYGYLASESVDALGERHGRSVVWHALVLDANFQSQDRIRIPASAMRSDYVMRDTERLAAYMGLPYKAPSPHSLHTELAARIFSGSTIATRRRRRTSPMVCTAPTSSMTRTSPRPRW